MIRTTRPLAALAATAALVAAPTAALAAGATQYQAVFDAGTAGPITSSVRGTLTIQPGTGGNTRVVGDVTGLAANSLFVAVPYSDPRCTPLPGITAFPSGTWYTDATGSAHVDVQVNPQSINPLGSFSADQTRSVSIRRVVAQSQPIPIGVPTNLVLVPTSTPTVPNVAYVEACDTSPDPVQ